MSTKTPSFNLRAIDKLCKKARTLLPVQPLEAREIALDAQQRLLSRPLQSPVEQRRLASVLVLLAHCASSTREFAVAAEYAQKALGILQGSTAVRECAEAQHTLGFALWYTQGQTVEGIVLLQQSLELLDSEPHRHLDLYFDILCDMGVMHWQIGEYEKAQVCMERSLAIATQGEDREREARALLSLGNLHGSQNNHNPALAYFIKGLAVIEEHVLDIPLEQGKLYRGIGTVLLGIGSYDQALEYFLRGLRLFEDSAALSEAESVLLNIGLLHKRNGAYEEALEYLYRSLALCEQLKSYNDRSYCLLNIAGTLLELQQYDDVLQYAQQCYDICENSGDRRMKSHALHAMGRALLGLDRADEGILRLQEGFAVCQEIQYHHETILIGAEIGMALGKTGRLEQGKEHLLAALALAEKMGQKPLLLDVHEAATTLYEMLGDYELALQHYKKTHDLHTALFNENSDQRLQALHVLHQIEEAKREADLYKVQTTHLQQQMEEQKRTIAAKAMYLSQRADLLAQIKKALLSVVSEVEGEAQHKVQSIITTVHEALHDNQSWNSFEDQFQHLQHAFIEELQRQYPQLSAMELRVCSLLKMNLSSKEICRILNIAPRSVDMHRYRIRKKLQLSSDANLQTFLAQVEPDTVP